MLLEPLLEAKVQDRPNGRRAQTEPPKAVRVGMLDGLSEHSTHDGTVGFVGALDLGLAGGAGASGCRCGGVERSRREHLRGLVGNVQRHNRSAVPFPEVETLDVVIFVGHYFVFLWRRVSLIFQSPTLGPPPISQNTP